MARVVFFCHDSRENISSFEYYNQDVEALKALGHEVVICTRYREIPLRFDLMFVWWWTYALWPLLLARLMRRPSVVTGVFNFKNPPGFSGMDYLHRPVHQRVLISCATRLASLNLFIDESEHIECRAHFRLPERAAAYLPCTVHEDYLQGPATDRELAIFNIAWSGRGNLVRKGIPELLQAIRILRDQGLRVHLYQAGHRGDGADDLERMVLSLGLEQQVTLLGPLTRSEKIARLRRCELYVQPSRFEGFGLATAEAMGCGACVVTCDVGAVRNVVGDCGLYVTPENPEELAASIRLAYLDSAIRIGLQQQAVKRARAVFAPEKKRAALREHLLRLGLA